MFDNVLSFFGLANDDASFQGDFRRKRIRYSDLNAEVVVGKNSYPVHDWDMNGIAFETTPDNYMDVGTKVQMNIRFNFPLEPIVVEQEAVIFRIAQRGISVAMFNGIQPTARRQFERVLDNLYTQKFLESQVA